MTLAMRQTGLALLCDRTFTRVLLGLTPRCARLRLTDASVAEFFDKVPVLKASAEDSLLAFDPCSLEDRVYRERSSTEPLFFFMYSCLFFRFACVSSLRRVHGERSLGT